MWSSGIALADCPSRCSVKAFEANPLLLKRERQGALCWQEYQSSWSVISPKKESLTDGRSYGNVGKLERIGETGQQSPGFRVPAAVPEIRSVAGDTCFKFCMVESVDFSHLDEVSPKRSDAKTLPGERSWPLRLSSVVTRMSLGKEKGKKGGLERTGGSDTVAAGQPW